MSKKLRRFKAILMLTLIFTMASSSLAFAAMDAGQIEKALNDGGYDIKTLPKECYTDKVQEDASTVSKINVGGKNYYLFKDKLGDAEKAINNANSKKETEEAVDSAEGASEIEGDLSEIFSPEDYVADVGFADQALSGFKPVIAQALGVIVMLITIGMSVYSAFDICYLAFPVFRNKCEDAKQSGQGMMVSGKKTESGESKLRFVTDDAQYAIVAANTVNDGKNPFIIYFKKRLIVYMVLAVLLFILLTGRIQIFTELALKVTDGILRIIQTTS